MATRRYKLSVGETHQDVVDEVGAAVNSDTVEVTIELAASVYKTGGGTRTISKDEAIMAIEQIADYIAKSDWPPA